MTKYFKYTILVNVGFMMHIDIRKINAQKKYVGNMEFEYSAPETLIQIPSVQFNGPVKVTFEYELFEDDSIEIRGRVIYGLQGACTRCLKPILVNVVGDLDAYFEPRKDYEDYGYTNGKVDLTQAVEDAIMASMPYVILCQEECEGISYNGETDS